MSTFRMYGTLEGEGMQIFSSPAELGGEFNITAEADVITFINALLSGMGTLSSDVEIIKFIISTLMGAGTLSAELSKVWRPLKITIEVKSNKVTIEIEG